MTDREQFYLAAFIIGILLLLAWWTSQPAESAQPERYEVYVVQPEDTIDGIVRAKYPEKNPTEMTYIVREINGKDGKLLNPGKIFPGQRLRIPTK